MKLKDERLINYLKKKFEGKNIDIENFLSPSVSDLRDAKLLKNIGNAVNKIKNAISENKKILIYGDYDCDGICASTILYLYLKSQNANVDVFIPNRFEYGYGISVDAIDEIISDYSPELIVTVDLGITAVEEVEILKQEGIDVVITDHHIPLDEIPDTIVVDPKLESDYGFDALCGAGVAFKLVEALSSREEALKYVDICAIATVGDIVPLIDENRAIVTIGLDKIHKNDCLKSISFLLKKLDIANVNSTDISFKIVPRLNACGRMDNAIKVFDFLIETDDALLEEKYEDIESDNTARLAFIDKGNKIIEKSLSEYNTNEPAIIVKGDFHEGIIGILASRVCHEYGKPTIIFTKTEDGTYKGSGRSIESVDLHKIISTMTDMLENFGGHKMAVGVEIDADIFDEFKARLNEKLKEEFSESDFVCGNEKVDIIITDDDLNENFYKELSLLEPFGCENEKPVLAIEQEKMTTERLSDKAFKHYHLFTKKQNSLTAFNFYKFIPIIESTCKKQILIDLSINTYKQKSSLSSIARGIILGDDISLDNNNRADLLSSLYNLYYSLFDFNNKDNYHISNDLEKVIQEKFSESEFGSLVVCSNNDDLEIVKKLNLQKYYSAKTHSNGQNTILISPVGVYKLDDVKSYKNIIFLHKHFENEHLFYSQKLNVYESEKIDKFDKNLLSEDREIFVKVYKLISNFIGLKANDEIDFARRISLKDGSLNECQILYSLIVFMELNFVEFDEILNSFKMLKAKKMELTSSLFYKEVNKSE